MKVSIIIKALNEEANIARSIESALQAVSDIDGGGEVILADSLSTDRTIDIACRYPVRIVQLKNPGDRSCGVGAQLGFQVASGDYLYIFDADMEFHDGFLPVCIAFLDANPECAGVGGLISEMGNSNLEFQERYKRKTNTLVKAGRVSFLGMGGLYRREALNSVGYFTNRQLNSYEEFELGARLNQAGWFLERLQVEGVKHYGYEIGEYSLLLKRIRTGYIFGLGELLKTAWQRSFFQYALKNLRQIRTYSAYLAWSLLVVGSLLIGLFNSSALAVFLLMLFMPVVVLWYSKKSLSTAVYNLVSGMANGWGMLLGFIKARPDNPEAPLDFEVLSKPVKVAVSK